METLDGTKQSQFTPTFCRYKASSTYVQVTFFFFFEVLTSTAEILHLENLVIWFFIKTIREFMSQILLILRA